MKEMGGDYLLLSAGGSKCANDDLRGWASGVLGREACDAQAVVASC